jgi:protein Tex
MKPIDLRIAEELGVRAPQVAAATLLLDSGATVPFVARYRKEATGALDDTQLRRLEERLRYLRELDERRAAILDSISQQGKLDAALKHAIDAADSKARLEDLYLPYRPKRRTKSQIARTQVVSAASKKESSSATAREKKSRHRSAAERRCRP